MTKVAKDSVPVIEAETDEYRVQIKSWQDTRWREEVVMAILQADLFFSAL